MVYQSELGGLILPPGSLREDTIWPTDVMDPVLFYEGLLIDTHVYIPLLLHKLLREFPNR